MNAHGMEMVLSTYFQGVSSEAMHVSDQVPAGSVAPLGPSRCCWYEDQGKRLVVEIALATPVTYSPMSPRR